ncbi:Nickel-dependent superoxide dismutase [hydrothermal vent metagenome]|uniref:Nickel-dependent superoxide dismutase n=1 Tax=hydrothermal vent metagenome TaxID=652676 RepID=A0A3B0Z0L4_9ZZZZ
MLHSILSVIDKKISLPDVSAHCDIPCKIYDPSTAQIAVLTMIRITDLVEELNAKGSLTIKDQAQLIRLINEKEAHGVKVKEEIRVIWGDYFKQPQFDQVPGVHELVHSIMLQASKAKQSVDRADGVALLGLVNKFTEAFWLTKGVKTFKAASPYPPAETVVYPVLEPTK